MAIADRFPGISPASLLPWGVFDKAAADAYNRLLREFTEASILLDTRQAIAEVPCTGAVGYSTDEVNDLAVALSASLWEWMRPWMAETEPGNGWVVESSRFLAEAVLQPAFARMVTEARGGSATVLPGILGATQTLHIRGEVEDCQLIVHGAFLDEWPKEIAFAGNLYRLVEVDESDPALPLAEYRKKAYSRLFS